MLQLPPVADLWAKFQILTVLWALNPTFLRLQTCQISRLLVQRVAPVRQKNRFWTTE